MVGTVAASVLSIATQQSPSRVESVRQRLVEIAWLHVLCSYTLQCRAVVVRQCEGSSQLGNMKGQLTIFVTVKLQSARVCTECVLGVTVCVCGGECSNYRELVDHKGLLNLIPSYVALKARHSILSISLF